MEKSGKNSKTYWTLVKELTYFQCIKVALSIVNNSPSTKSFYGLKKVLWKKSNIRKDCTRFPVTCREVFHNVDSKEIARNVRMVAPGAVHGRSLSACENRPCGRTRARIRADSSIYKPTYNELECRLLQGGGGLVGSCIEGEKETEGEVQLGGDQDTERSAAPAATFLSSLSLSLCLGFIRQALHGNATVLYNPPLLTSAQWSSHYVASESTNSVSFFSLSLHFPLSSCTIAVLFLPP